ncbi:MAG: xanthine dehydrogenase family protein molybdopterin-binding subunit [Chloroflexota bacterium]|nr:xanthine dehydrogenase family protein molybdopterin-binding subunit [Chloroflexota bacterium]
MTAPGPGQMRTARPVSGYVGAAMPMRDALERVSGTVPFTLNHALPGMAHAKVVRSPYPHALIRGIDPSAALELPGVITVLTRDDLGSESGLHPYYGGSRQDQPVVAIDRVRHVGDAVAVIVAETAAIAADALNLIDVDYEELPYVTDADEASAADAPRLHDAYPGNACGAWTLRHGEIEQGWRESDRVYEHIFRSPTANHVPMEPHVTVAHLDEAGVMNVWTASQSPYAVQAGLMKILNLPAERVRVIVLNLGGGYGGKGGIKLEPMAACAARQAGRPVRLALDREEVFATIAKHAARVWIKTGVKRDGTLVARQVDVAWNAGAYAVSSPFATRQGMVRAPGPYRIPHVAVDSRGYYTNTVPTGPFRGAMTSQLCWAYESQLDQIASDLGLDPVAMRQRNLLRDGDTYPTGEVFRHVHYLDLLRHMADALDWQPEDGHVRRPGPDGGKVRGKGVAFMIKHTITPSRSEAIIELADDGACTVLSSSVEMGQGTRTSLHQLAADALGVPLERITAPFPDTARTPYDLTTSSSRTAYSMGVALQGAADDVRGQLQLLAADVLEAATADIEVGNGTVGVTGNPGPRLTYDDLMRRAGVAKIVGNGVFQSPPGAGELDESGQGIATVHWHEGAVGVEVEVDTATGKVHVVKAHAGSYAGRVLNPVLVRQQNEGNVIFGLGPALFEEYVWDQGQMVNPNLSDYMIPSFLDVPDQLTSVALTSDDPAADVHGVGEMTVPPVAPAIGNAIFHATGARIYDLPMTAERVYRAIHEAANGDATEHEADRTTVS